jgi:polysaccharide biosynthesis/export protein
MPRKLPWAVGMPAGLALAAATVVVTAHRLGVRQVGKWSVNGRCAAARLPAYHFDSPEVTVETAGDNKVYYVVTEGAGLGDNVMRVPITGNDTVLDGLSQLGGVSQLSSKRIWVARPTPGELGCEQVMPVDWEAICRGGDTSSNYQLLPGDRLFIEDPALDSGPTWADWILSWLTGWLAEARSSQTIGRAYNQSRDM